MNFYGLLALASVFTANIYSMQAPVTPPQAARPLFPPSAKQEHRAAAEARKAAHLAEVAVNAAFHAMQLGVGAAGVDEDGDVHMTE